MSEENERSNRNLAQEIEMVNLQTEEGTLDPDEALEDIKVHTGDSMFSNTKQYFETNWKYVLGGVSGLTLLGVAGYLLFKRRN